VPTGGVVAAEHERDPPLSERRSPPRAIRAGGEFCVFVNAALSDLGGGGRRDLAQVRRLLRPRRARPQLPARRIVLRSAAAVGSRSGGSIHLEEGLARVLGLATGSGRQPGELFGSGFGCDVQMLAVGAMSGLVWAVISRDNAVV
jgi:hypothetical protein